MECSPDKPNAGAGRAVITRPRCNRVSPFGRIEATSHRGILLGNRGDLHGEDGTVVRNWRLRRWISCVLDYPRGSKITFDTPGSYTPLFFLDELVALAAGHRPCAGCRPSAYRAFRDAWQMIRGRPNQFIAATEIDLELHRWRVELPISGKLSSLSALPAGTFITLPQQSDLAWLWTGHSVRPWSHEGYGPAVPSPVDAVSVLTPQPIVQVLMAGYQPVRSAALTWHHEDAIRRSTLEGSDTGRTQLALL